MVRAVRVAGIDLQALVHEDRLVHPGLRIPAGQNRHLETVINNGTLFDPIGVVDDRRGPDGYPLVINIWTVGAETASMPLLGQSYPTAVAHFRLGRAPDYE